MGFARSSHYFNRVVQKSLSEIAKCHMEVDDILIEAVNEDEAADSLRQVLERCRHKNIKLARYKIQCGPEIDFAGIHLGGQGGYRPSQSKIDTLIGLPAPTNITELRAFLGAYNQLRSYMPDLTHSTIEMTKLLKADVPFV